MRGCRFGISGDSGRHSRPEEPLLLGPTGEDRFSVISCFIVIVLCSVGDSERGSKAADSFAVSFNANAGCSENSGLKRSITEINKKSNETKYHKFLNRHTFAARLVQKVVHP